MKSIEAEEANYVDDLSKSFPRVIFTHASKPSA
jgi:hypothetical protein